MTLFGSYIKAVAEFTCTSNRDCVRVHVLCLSLLISFCVCVCVCVICSCDCTRVYAGVHARSCLCLWWYSVSCPHAYDSPFMFALVHILTCVVLLFFSYPWYHLYIFIIIVAKYPFLVVFVFVCFCITLDPWRRTREWSIVQPRLVWYWRWWNWQRLQLLERLGHEFEWQWSDPFPHRVQETQRLLQQWRVRPVCERSHSSRHDGEVLSDVRRGARGGHRTSHQGKWISCWPTVCETVITEAECLFARF